MPELRVTFVQPALAQYRVPFFRELASRKGLSVRVLYGAIDGLPNDSADGFDALPDRLHEFSLGGVGLYHQASLLGCLNPKQCDVAVLPWFTRYPLLVPALVLARRKRIPTLLWGHGYSKRENMARKALRTIVGSLASGVVVYEEHTAAKLNSSRMLRGKVFSAPNTVDQAPIRAARRTWLESPERLAAFRAEHGLEAGPTVLYIGRLYAQNKVELLIEALPLIARRESGVNVVLIGKENEYTRHLRDMATMRGVADRLVWVGELYDEQRLAPWMLSAQIMCYPENIGLSIFHAMGYGLPVVTADNTGHHNPEIFALERGVNGETYASGDANALAETLVRMISSPEKLSAMSKAALATAEHFTIGRMADGFERAIQHAAASCVGRGRPGSDRRT